MIRRNIEQELIRLSKSYPVITITGPRQSGKTTLTRMVFPQYNYCNLENPEVRKLAQTDANAFLKRYSPPVILDEIQRVPDLLSYIQVIVDEKKVNGAYILTGSQQLNLSAFITQSLAGRTALLCLLPFSIKEVQATNSEINRDLLMYKGFMPRIYDQNLNPTRAYRNYFQTYVERDLRQLIQVKNLTHFENFLRLLAGRIGQVLNMASLSNDLGVSSTTLIEWLSVLEASYIIFRLEPYYENLGKRIIKSPKIYFVEVGLAAYLLGIERPDQIARDPLIGSLFENMVVIEALKARYNKGMDSNLYFFRDNNKNEVDLIYKQSRQLIPIEIKAAMTYNDKLVKGINYFQKISKTKGYLIYAGSMTWENPDMEILSYLDMCKIFNDV